MVLPLVKLGTLALRTLCKPIASRLKKEAGLHPRFRQMIINFAQANHRFQTNMQRRIYGHATDVAIRPLNEEKAVQAAADLLGELFVFSQVCHGDKAIQGIGGSLDAQRALEGAQVSKASGHPGDVAGAAVIFEVQRSARSEARKEELRKQELGAMRQKDEELAREVELLKQKIEELEHLSRGKGLSGIFNFKHPQGTEDVKSGKPY